MSNLKKFDSIGDLRNKYMGARNAFDVFDTFMDNVFNDFGYSTINTSYDINKSDAFFSPKLDILENENNLEITAEVPGATKIDLSLEDGNLIISGEKNISENVSKAKAMKKSERFYGKFYRSLYLGNEYKHDTIKATQKDGILTITIEKNKEESPKKIQINIEK